MSIQSQTHPAPGIDVKGKPFVQSVRSLPVYAFMLPIIPALFIYSGNTNRITPDAFLSTALAFLACYLAVSLLLRSLTRHKRLCDLLLATLFIGFAVNINNLGDGQLIWFAEWGLAALLIWYFKKIRSYVHTFYSALSLVVVAATAISCIVDGPMLERSPLQTAVDSRFPPLKAGAATDQPPRDIYYIVLDRYARADQLLKIYSHDNSKFINALGKHGFQVANNAYSNYQRTAHSLSSSLNMDYLDRIADHSAQTSNDWVPIYRTIQNSRLVNFLKQQNYRFEFYGTWWEPTRLNYRADRQINVQAWPELIRVIFENSVAGQIARYLQIADLDPRMIQCTRAKKKFQNLTKSVRQNSGEQPKFVFAHFLVPHPPFVLSENGECLSTETVAAHTREHNFVQQVKYANRQILNFLDAIKKAPGPRPIIVLQADEGPWPRHYVRDEIHRLGLDVTPVNWRQASTADLREKMAILNALHLPDSDLIVLDNQTPVNNFRAILSHYFGADLPKLADRSHIFPDRHDLYHFDDVTERLNAP